MIIMKADFDDLPAILTLQYLAYQSEAKLFHDPDIPPLKQTLPEVQEEYEKGIFWKACSEGGQIIGSVRAYEENGTVYIGKLIVEPKYQRQGIGTCLLKKVEEEYQEKRCELFTSTRSKNNLKLYQSLGYRVFRERAVTEELKFLYLEKLRMDRIFEK